MPSNRIIPLIIAVAFFMENMDATVIATSLPAIAADIGTNPLALKLAITSYLLSLAIFIPASGWVADRFGTRTVFCTAIVVFVIGSIGCAFSGSLTDFVIARIVQGIGGAMMTPVGRMVLLRSYSKRELVGVMAWVTTPALIGPVIGPPVGGFITTYATWHWIFLINVPMGLLGIALAWRFIPNVRAQKRERFDLLGMMLAGLGIAGLAFGLSVAGLNFLPWSVVAALVAFGAIFTTAYLLHARHTPLPALDLKLFRIPTFYCSVVGGFAFRLGIGSLAFLLPLMLQIGFGMTPFQSGLITFGTAIGAMGMKTATTTVLRWFGFRTVMVYNAVISTAFLAACALFTPSTPVWLMIVILVAGGFFRSLQFTAINTLAYAEIDHARVGRATSLVSVQQQLAISSGVAIGALAVEMMTRIHGHDTLQASDFQAAFLIVAAISLTSVLFFLRLAPDAGAELANRLPAAETKTIESSDQKVV